VEVMKKVGIKRHGGEKVVAGLNMKKGGNVFSKDKNEDLYEIIFFC
jgi:hypothetical protein